MKAIVDCNSFYCSCERVFRPDLRKKPVIVLSNNDSCIISRTDEAKRLGVEMAGLYFEVRHLIEKHDVATFSSNYNLYGDMSRRVMGYFINCSRPETCRTNFSARTRIQKSRCHVKLHCSCQIGSK